MNAVPALHRRRFRSPLAGLVAAALVVLAGCGGDGDDDDAAPPVNGNSAPVAAFSSAATVVAGTPLTFDASASSDADGDALGHGWSFGDGQRGGGAKIAHVFAEPGSFTVRLTVDDGKGGSGVVEHAVTVTAGPPAAGKVDTLAVVRDASGALLAGVTVRNLGGGPNAVTGADGRALVGTDLGVPVALRFSKDGFADQFKAFTLPASAESGYVEVTLGSREPPLVLADGAAGGTVTGKDGAKVTFRPGTLVDAAGAPIGGAVQVTLTPIDVASAPRTFPGRFAGVRTTGDSGVIMSFGTVEFVLAQGGAPVQLAPGRTATIEIPIYTGLHVDGTAVKAGDAIPLWSLDERTAGWTEEGTGNVVVSPSTPTGFALRAEASHFSWWNSDWWLSPTGEGRPKPKCLVDTNLDGVAEDLSGTGYCSIEGTGGPGGGPFNPKPLPGRDRAARAATASPIRVPVFLGQAMVPAAGGQVLPIPAKLDVTLRAYAKNATLYGSKLVNFDNRMEADVPILLEPVHDNPGTIAIGALPYVDRFLMTGDGEVDRFTFTAAAGVTYRVTVGGSSEISSLAGDVQITGPASQVLGGGGFATAAFSQLVTVGAGGTVTIRVAAGANAPGGYPIEVRAIAASCAGATPLAVSTTIDFGVPANSTTCFDVALAADDVVEIRNTQNLSARGSVTLSTPAGEVIATDPSYGAGFDAIFQRVGIATAGTYRVAIVNTSSTGGQIVGFTVAKVTPVGVLGSTSTDSFSAPANTGATSRLYLLKPGALPAVAVKLDTHGIAQSFRIWPSQQLATPLDGSVIGRVVPVPTQALAVVEVLRASAQTATNYVISTGVPQTLAKNADLDLATPAAGDIAIYRVDGTAGDLLSLGTSYSPSSDVSPIARVYAPSTGNPVNPASRVLTLVDGGAQTLVVSSPGTPGSPFRLRINDVAPIEAIALSALTERTATLALGEVRRYGFAAPQGQVLRLRLSTPGAFDVQAVIGGGPVGNITGGGVALQSQGVAGPQSGATDALYVQQSVDAVLSVYGSSPLNDRATGSATFGLEAPAPQAAVPGQLLAPTLQPNTLSTFAYTVPTAGSYALCTTYAGPLDLSGQSRLAGRVFGPTPTSSNYTGDLVGGLDGNATEAIAPLRAGANTLALVNTFAAATPVTAVLVALPAPAAIAVGSAATAASLAACERRTFRFAATGGTGYTARVTAAFAGTVRVYKEGLDNGPGFNLGGGQTLSPNVERVLAFTVPANATFGSGDYIVEVDGDANATGNFSVQLTSP